MIKEAFTPIGEKICSGVAMVYQEFDLLWLAALPDDEEEEMSVKAFETAFATLPRWETTRYAVISEFKRER